MFGIGPTELFVVAVLALVLFSPRELPGMLRSVMKFWGSIKRTADEFKDAIMQEESFQELRDVYDGSKSTLRKAESDARRELMQARSEMRKAQGKLTKVASVAKARAEVDAASLVESAAKSEPAKSEPEKSAPAKSEPAKPEAAGSTEQPKAEQAKPSGDSAANQGAA